MPYASMRRMLAELFVHIFFNIKKIISKVKLWTWRAHLFTTNKARMEWDEKENKCCWYHLAIPNMSSTLIRTLFGGPSTYLEIYSYIQFGAQQKITLLLQNYIFTVKKSKIKQEMCAYHRISYIFTFFALHLITIKIRAWIVIYILHVNVRMYDVCNI